MELYMNTAKQLLQYSIYCRYSTFVPRLFQVVQHSRADENATDDERTRKAARFAWFLFAAS